LDNQVQNKEKRFFEFKTQFEMIFESIKLENPIASTDLLTNIVEKSEIIF
jgi:hypothetical protein